MLHFLHFAVHCILFLKSSSYFATVIQRATYISNQSPVKYSSGSGFTSAYLCVIYILYVELFCLLTLNVFQHNTQFKQETRKCQTSDMDICKLNDFPRYHAIVELASWHAITMEEIGVWYMLLGLLNSNNQLNHPITSWPVSVTINELPIQRFGIRIRCHQTEMCELNGILNCRISAEENEIGVLFW